MNKNTRKNNLKDNFKNSKKKKLTTWQCFQKEFIPQLQGDRSNRNKQAAIIWNGKNDLEKELYDCQDNNLKKNDKILKDKDQLSTLLHKIEGALNYKVKIPELKHSISFINYELLRKLIDQSDNLINNKKYQKLDNFSEFVFQIDLVKKELKEREEQNNKSASDLENYLDSEIQTTDNKMDNLDKLIKKTEIYNIEGNNNELIDEANIRKIELDEINKTYNSAKDFKDMNQDEFLDNLKLLEERINYFSHDNPDIVHSISFLKIKDLFNKMKIYNNIFIQPFDNHNIIMHKFKINKKNK